MTRARKLWRAERDWYIYIVGNARQRVLSLRDMAKKIKVSPTFLSRSRPEDWKPGEEKRANCGSYRLQIL